MSRRPTSSGKRRRRRQRARLKRHDREHKFRKRPSGKQRAINGKVWKDDAK